MCSFSRLRTTRSTSLPRNVRFDIGLLLVSIPSPFIVGITSATFRPSMEPVDSERLTKSQRVGRNIPRLSFSKSVGMKSDGEHLIPDSLIISCSSATSQASKFFRQLLENGECART